MLVWVYILFIYEVFANIQTEFARRSMGMPTYATSALERKLWKNNSVISFLAMAFMLLARINGIVFLIFLAVTTVWWHPLVIWVGCLIATPVAVSLFRGQSGLAIPGLLAFLVLPLTGTWLWFNFLT